MKRVVILLICILLFLSSCGNSDTLSTYSSTEKETYDLSEPENNITVSFSDTDDSPLVFISAEDAAAIAEYTKAMSREYTYSEYFETEEAYSRITTPYPAVTKHRFSALNNKGELDADTLFEKVKKNNEEYLKGDDDFNVRMSSEPEDELIREFCGIITETVNTMAEKYPDIDRNRVYCNLGNLKVLNVAGMLSFAEVSTDLVMKVGEENRKMSEIATNGENRYNDIIAHETMHIIQVGCSCEEIENCNRRCGISRRYDDFELNTSEFRWLFEGGAERSVCNLTGREPVTYTTMIGYIGSLDLACMFKDGASVDAVETVSFYNDPEKLFSLFGCESEEDYLEIMNMLISINVIQTEDSVVAKAYGEKNSIDMEDLENINDMNRKMKPEICRTLSKYFYRNLADTLAKGMDITANDLCFMIKLFEASIDTHLRFSDPELTDYNAEFVSAYKELRAMLFDAVNVKCGVDIAAMYNTYGALNEGESVINASMKWNDEIKNAFMLERTYANLHRINEKVK